MGSGVVQADTQPAVRITAGQETCRAEGTSFRPQLKSLIRMGNGMPVCSAQILPSVKATGWAASRHQRAATWRRASTALAANE